MGKRLKLASQRKRDRKIAAMWIEGNHTQAEIGARFKISASAVSMALKRRGVRNHPQAVKAMRARLSKRRQNEIALGKRPGRPPIWPDCPAHLKSDYCRFRKAYGIPAAEARAMLEAVA